MRFETTRELDVDPATVWAVLTDVERWPEWTDSIRLARRLDDGGFAVGSRVWLEQLRLRPAIWEVTELTTERSFTWVSTSGGVRTVGGHRIVALPEGRVRVELTVEQSGLLAPVVGRLVGGVTRRYLQMEADGLARRCASA